jgi:hypothetical protein
MTHQIPLTNLSLELICIDAMMHFSTNLSLELICIDAMMHFSTNLSLEVICIDAMMHFSTIFKETGIYLEFTRFLKGNQPFQNHHLWLILEFKRT